MTVANVAGRDQCVTILIYQTLTHATSDQLLFSGLFLSLKLFDLERHIAVFMWLLKYVFVEYPI